MKRIFLRTNRPLNHNKLREVHSRVCFIFANQPLTGSQNWSKQRRSSSRQINRRLHGHRAGFYLITSLRVKHNSIITHQGQQQRRRLFFSAYNSFLSLTLSVFLCVMLSPYLLTPFFHFCLVFSFAAFFFTCEIYIFGLLKFSVSASEASGCAPPKLDLTCCASVESARLHARAHARHLMRTTPAKLIFNYGANYWVAAQPVQRVARKKFICRRRDASRYVYERGCLKIHTQSTHAKLIKYASPSTLSS